MKQYPHFLYVRSLSESTKDENGNWTESSGQWLLHSVCREETNGKGQLINGPDGKSIVFSSVVYMPKSAIKIEEGTEVLISESEDPEGAYRIKKQVLKFDVGQLSCRLWV